MIDQVYGGGGGIFMWWIKFMEEVVVEEEEKDKEEEKKEELVMEEYTDMYGDENFQWSQWFIICNVISMEICFQKQSVSPKCQFYMIISNVMPKGITVSLESNSK